VLDNRVSCQYGEQARCWTTGIAVSMLSRLGAGQPEQLYSEYARCWTTGIAVSMVSRLWAGQPGQLYGE
jgi:hypothetical protein